jgi:hypothetical protein
MHIYAVSAVRLSSHVILILPAHDIAGLSPRHASYCVRVPNIASIVSTKSCFLDQTATEAEREINKFPVGRVSNLLSVP